MHNGLNHNGEAYLLGSFTPVLTFATAGDLAVTYSTRVGQFVRVGPLVMVNVNILTSGFTHTTALGNCQITGLPFISANVTNSTAIGGVRWQGITKANYTDVVASLAPDSSTAQLFISGSGQAPAIVAVGDMPTGGTVRLTFSLTYQAA